jgi:hypothetical protein
MTLSGDAVRRIREAFSKATATPIDEGAFAARFGLPANSERDGVNGPGALALPYLSQGLPGFCGNLSEWSFQRPFDHDKPDKVLCRLWWPRFVAQITDAHGRAQLGRVFWIDDPEDRREAIIKAACETFILQMSGEEE